MFLDPNRLIYCLASLFILLSKGNDWWQNLFVLVQTRHMYCPQVKVPVLLDWLHTYLDASTTRLSFHW